MFQRLATISFLLMASQARAVRTAVFPAAIHGRAAIWLDQGRIFDQEAGTDKQRPIWIHGGDSLSSGWSNGPSIRQTIARAERSAIPDPGSLGDYVSHLPDATQTWYAGSNLQGGLLGVLDRLASGQTWVVISTALAGATITPQGSEDPLAYMMQVREPERVRLITFSLGNNDVCDGFNPARTTEFHTKLRALREKFSKAQIVPFEIVDVRAMHQAIIQRLEQLPVSIGRNRMLNYCRIMWQRACPETTQANSRADEIRREIMATMTDELGPAFNLMQPANGVDPLDLLSSDCFHPAGAMEGSILAPLKDFISTRLTLAERNAMNPTP